MQGGGEGPYRIAFFVLLAGFLAMALAGLDHSCLDAADSAYLASAAAVAHGLVPYRDFLSAHPPLLFLLGAPLAAAGGGVLPFRIFTLLAMAATALVTRRLGTMLSGDAGTGFLAGAFALFAPLGIYFSRLFLQDILVALAGAVAVLLLLRDSHRRTVAAGLVCVAGTLTKLTFLPLLVALALFVCRYRRQRLAPFLAAALGGSLLAALVLEAITGGAYFDDIIFAQASKTLGFTNFYEGLHRVWQLDWPLLLVAVTGLAPAFSSLRRRRNGELFLFGGWLVAGLVPLLTLPAAGHDTNLFQPAEPPLALLAAWGITGLATRRRAAATAAAVLLLGTAAAGMTIKDRDLFRRSNAADVAAAVSVIDERSDAGTAVLVPGCYALEAGRPVARRFYDQFLWEELYLGGDPEAESMFAGLAEDLEARRLPVVIFGDDRASRSILASQLDAAYRELGHSESWPPVTTYVPGS